MEFAITRIASVGTNVMPCQGKATSECMLLADEEEEEAYHSYC
jgi:hypothetical protein